MTDPLPPRRGFKSKTPLGINAPRTRGWAPATRHQYSGWKFQVRRTSNGAALHDTRMLTDPLGRQGQALRIGAIIAAVLIVGAGVLAIFRPAGVGGNESVYADRSSGGLYVVVNDQMHPVLNLASARLIVGRPDAPKVVKTSEIDKHHDRGPTLGIEHAPTRMDQASSRDSRWTVCDAATGAASGTTVIIGDPVEGPGRAAPLGDNAGVLVRGGEGSQTWLIWDGKRAKIDLGNSAVSAAVGIGIDTPHPRPINSQLLNLIPESPPLIAPFLANRGDAPRFPWLDDKPAPVVGSVVVDHQDGRVRNYAVTGDGLQAISPVLAAILRATDSHGLVEPPELTPDQVARMPIASPIPVDNYPAQPLDVADPVTDPVTCAQWVKLAGAPTSSLRMLVGQTLPVAEDDKPVTLAPGPTTAAHVIAPAGVGYYVQVTGQEPTSATREARFWVSDLGVRYGLEAAQSSNPVEALGLQGDPLPVPWAVLSLLAPGPTLSKTDALLTH